MPWTTCKCRKFEMHECDEKTTENAQIHLKKKKGKLYIYICIYNLHDKHEMSQKERSKHSVLKGGGQKIMYTRGSVKNVTRNLAQCTSPPSHDIFNMGGCTHSIRGNKPNRWHALIWPTRTAAGNRHVGRWQQSLQIPPRNMSLATTAQGQQLQCFLSDC